MERLLRKIFFALIGLLALAWFTYWQAHTLGSIDERRSNAMCTSVTPGMTMEKVKAIASASKKTPIFSEHTAAIGYGACQCLVEFRDDRVVRVEKATCSH